MELVGTAEMIYRHVAPDFWPSAGHWSWHFLRL